MRIMASNRNVIISVALTGAGTQKSQNPAVPISPEEIAADVVACARAGAAIAHIHVRDENGAKTMALDRFVRTVELTRKACKEAGVDVLLNLTTSGGSYVDEERLAHLYALKPDMCSFDAGSLNWANSFVFENHPRFLTKLCEAVNELGIKPEVEVFDGGFMGNAAYYVKKGMLKTPVHYQFVLDVPGGLDGTVKNLSFLHDMLPEGSTWSVTGIGKAHMPMMLAGLAMGADGLRVGLEDNIMLNKEKGELATNVQLVERAVRLCRASGRDIATAEEARGILGLGIG